MKTTRAALGLVALAGLLAACSAERSNEPGPSSPQPDAGGGRDASGRGGASGTGGTSSGSGGSSSGTGGTSAGSGGSAASGTGGSSSGLGGAPGAGYDAAPLPDAGSSQDAAADAGGMAQPCGIELYPVAPLDFIRGLAGEGHRFRVGARLFGTTIPARPIWSWKVTRGTQTVMHTAVDGEPAKIDFPTLTEDFYDVRAEITGAMPACTPAIARVKATMPSKRIENFLVRVTPPPGKSLPVMESNAYVQSRIPQTKTLEFPNLPVYDVRPTDETDNDLPAYFVQISSDRSPSRFEGYVMKEAFRARLESGPRYNVLIVPDPLGGMGLRAPILFTGLDADGFLRTRFRVDEGATVSGKVKSASGPLEKARVRLRAGLLPSTVGEATATGDYQLRVRAGRFEVRVIPPAGSGLPEAQVPLSSGIFIPDFGLGGSLDFTYGAVDLVGLRLTVTDSAGAPADRTTVVLETIAGQLPNVGSFEVPGQGTVAADGALRISRDTVAGVVSYDKLPRARYRVVLVPPADLPGEHAITTIKELDLTTGAGPQLMRTAALVKRSRIIGKLTPPAGISANGLVVRAVDTAEDGIRRTVLLPVDGTGRFELPSDPDRVYRLFVEPPADRSLPRITLDPVRALAQPVNVQHTLPDRVTLTGPVLERGMPVAGAIVQIFCWGDAPACVDRAAPDLANTLPVDETISGADGTYKLSVPDPGQ